VIVGKDLAATAWITTGSFVSVAAKSQAVAGAETSRAALARHEETGPIVKLYSVTMRLFHSRTVSTVWMTRPTQSRRICVRLELFVQQEPQISDE
jgi:hypothetical protein